MCYATASLQALRISLLPESPFVALARQQQHQRPGEGGGSGREDRSLEGMSLASRLENILMDETERRRRSDSNLSLDSNSVSSFPFRSSAASVSERGTVRPSDETRHSLSGDFYTTENDLFGPPAAAAAADGNHNAAGRAGDEDDEDEDNDELPFAWGEADILGTVTTSTVAATPVAGRGAAAAASSSTLSGRKNVTLPFGLSSKFSYGTSLQYSETPIAYSTDSTGGSTVTSTAASARDAAGSEYLFHNSLVSERLFIT